MMSEGDKGFEVKDRRKAKDVLEDATEAVHSGDGPEAGGKPRETGTQEGGPGSAGGAAAGEKAAGKHAAEPPRIDFISFIGSLAATAFFHMGEKLSPDQPEGKVDLAAAKQMIDLIDLMKAKTSGNLEKEESDALDNILYSLRMRYVQAAGGK